MRHQVVRTKFLAVFMVSLSALIVGCAKGGPDPERTLNLRMYDAQVPKALAKLQLRAVTFGGFQDFNTDGEAKINLPEGRTQVGVVVERKTDRMVLLSYSFPEWIERDALRPFTSRNDKVKVNAESTALALTMINPLFFGTTIEQKADIAEKAVILPEFNELTRQIRKAWDDDPTNALDYNRNPHLFYLAHDVSVSAAKMLVDERVPQNAPRRAASIDKDAAWIEQISGLNAVFKNPKMIYYGAGVYTQSASDKNPTATVLVNDKEKVIDFSIWPPKVEIAAPRETPYTLPGPGLWRVGIFKGMDINMPLEEMWATPPAQLAFIGNTWQTVIMIISLAGDTGLVPGAGQVGSFMRSMMDFDDIYPIYQAIQTGDQMTIINAFVKFFQDHWTDIAGFIFNSVKSNGGDTQAASSLLGKVGELAGIATSLFNVVNVEVPFFYDLITAHPKAVYLMQDGVVSSSQVQTSSCAQVYYGAVPVGGLKDAAVSVVLLIAPLLIVIYIRRQERKVRPRRPVSISLDRG
ncbi:MAG: hypothetical protein HYT87_09855 [Nitrospirae bacterium]|nr:hypothetical protein [Nitrospirota bacterium]